jgi:hypothetical protein
MCMCVCVRERNRESASVLHTCGVQERATNLRDFVHVCVWQLGEWLPGRPAVPEDDLALAPGRQHAVEHGEGVKLLLHGETARGRAGVARIMVKRE